MQCIIANDPDFKRVRAEEAMLEAQALATAKSGTLDPYHQVETPGKLEIFDPTSAVLLSTRSIPDVPHCRISQTLTCREHLVLVVVSFHPFFVFVHDLIESINFLDPAHNYGLVIRLITLPFVPDLEEKS
jgi:hypothetical protein